MIPRLCAHETKAAKGVLREAEDRGIVVPDELSVIGFDGIAAAWTRPLLTTIEQPIDEIAETAVSALQRLIEDPLRPLPNFVFRPKLRLGHTTATGPHYEGPPAGATPSELPLQPGA